MVAKALGLGDNAEIPIYFAATPDKYASYAAQSMKRNGVAVEVLEIAKDPVARRIRQYALLIPYNRPRSGLGTLKQANRSSTSARPSPSDLSTVKQTTNRSFSTSARILSMSMARTLTTALHFLRK